MRAVEVPQVGGSTELHEDPVKDLSNRGGTGYGSPVADFAEGT
jgi:hypothetical protein